MQGLNLSVADLLGRPGEYRDFTISTALKDVGNPLARLDGAPVRGDLRAESVVEGVLVTGGVEAGGSFECARCLTKFRVPVAVELCELFATPGHEGPPDEDGYKVSGKELHLEPMLRDALALALPLKPVCEMACKGLCAGCGRNLNDETCICSHEELDPRWAELAVLRERLES